MKRAILLDLDNCISADAWRRVYLAPEYHDHDIEPKALGRFHAYHRLCYLDRGAFFVTLQVELRRLDQPKIIINTGRPELYRSMTVLWLKSRLTVEHILMRPNTDHSPAVELKKTNLKVARGELGYEIVGAYDDHADVVAMYRESGIEAKRVAIDENFFEGAT